MERFIVERRSDALPCRFPPPPPHLPFCAQLPTRHPLTGAAELQTSPQSKAPAAPRSEGSAVFRCLGDYVTHPGVLGLNFSMRECDWEMICCDACSKPDLRRSHQRCPVASDGKSSCKKDLLQNCIFFLHATRDLTFPLSLDTCATANIFQVFITN